MADRILNGMDGLVDQDNGFEPNVAALSDAELARQTQVFRERLAQG